MKSKVKISVIVTVKNDDSGIKCLLADLKEQTLKPDEIIIIRAEDYGNCSRGSGRNIGIRKAKNEFIAVTDVGCRPHKEWLEKITAGFNKGRVFEYKGQALFVVAGRYRAVAETDWQKAFLPYLVPAIKKDKKNKREKGGEGRTFLPASRSIAFTKSAWELVGGYSENASAGGEDLGFAVKLVRHPEVKMVYAPRALVDWELPGTWREFFRDMVKHTRGNFEIGYWPHMVRNFSVVGRWMVFLVWPWLIPIYLGLVASKRIKVIKNIKIIMIILITKLLADAAVIYGVISIIIIKWIIKRQ